MNQIKTVTFKINDISNNSLKKLVDFRICDDVEVINIICDKIVPMLEIERKISSLTEVLNTLSHIFSDDLFQYKKYTNNTKDEEFWIKIEEDQNSISILNNISELTKIIEFLNMLGEFTTDENEEFVNLSNGIYEYVQDKIIRDIGFHRWYKFKNRFEYKKEEIVILINGEE